MSSGVSRTVLLAEPTALVADVLDAALRRAGHHTFLTDVTASGLVAESERLKPTLVVIGPSFGRSGLAGAVPRLLAHDIRTVLVSPRGLDRVEAQIMMAGASGHLSASTDDIRTVASEVDRVVTGTSALNPEVVTEMLRQWRESRNTSEAPENAVGLTAREVDVVRGLSDGLTTRLIANRLGVTEKTVEAHKSRLFAKLGAKNSSQALQLLSARGRT